MTVVDDDDDDDDHEGAGDGDGDDEDDVQDDGCQGAAAWQQRQIRGSKASSCQARVGQRQRPTTSDEVAAAVAAATPATRTAAAAPRRAATTRRRGRAFQKSGKKPLTACA